MLAGSTISPRREKAAVDPLVVYLLNCGGSDVLHFQDSHAASNAAHTLRGRTAEVSVEARYEKVFLQLRT